MPTGTIFAQVDLLACCSSSSRTAVTLACSMWGPVHPYAQPSEKVCAAASIARKVYLRQNVGVGALRIQYGGRNKRRGTVPEHFAKASGGLIRHIFKQLGVARLPFQQCTRHLHKPDRIAHSCGCSLSPSLYSHCLAWLQLPSRHGAAKASPLQAHITV